VISRCPVSNTPPGAMILCLNGLRAEIDLYRVRFGTCNRQHQRCRISEVTLKCNGPGALRKLAAQRVELQVDVAELALQVIHIVD
jgi:hypothetical protein